MVMCHECGFLAVRHEKSRELVEMELDYRNTGEAPREIDSPKHPNIYGYGFPLCFKQAYSIGDEMKNEKGSLGEKIRSVIQRDRVCEYFTVWRQGFTPREHQEMLDRERMKGWEMEREELDRKWRMELEEKRSKDEWRRYVFMAIMMIVAAIVGILIGRYI